MRRRLWKCVSDFVLEVLKIVEKTLGIYKLPLLVDAINDGGRRNEECGIRNAESGTARQYRIPPRADKRRSPGV